MQNIVGKFDALRERMPKCVRKNEDAAGDGERSAVSGVQRQSISCGEIYWLFSVINCRIQNLCFSWENALSHGLKTTSIFQNIVSGNLTTESTSSTFWDFAYKHLTGHEKERFSTLRYGLCSRCSKFVSRPINKGFFLRSLHGSGQGASTD